MIRIKCIETEGVTSPERVLTAKEKETVTSILCNSVEYIYYQGDEPQKAEQPYAEPVEEKTDISNIDIDSLTDEQILKLKERFEAL